MFGPESDFEANVTLEADKTGVIDEPPFHILVLGDWSGDAGKNDLHRRKPLEIDRDNFDDIMKKLRVGLDIEAGELVLEFQGIDDFHPDELFRQVPIFAELRGLRQRLLNADTFNSASREVREWFPVQQKTDAADSVKQESDDLPAENLLDAILSKPGGGAAPPSSRSTHSSELNSLLSEIVRPHLVSVDENEQTSLVAAVDSATSSLMRSILHHRKFQKLEAAWRGLYFLVRRAETASDLKIFILDISKSELSEHLKTTANLTDSIVYEVMAADNQDDPWSAVFGNYAFEPNVDDIAALIRIGKLAAAAGAPFISHMRPEVLGISSLADQPDPADWKISDDSSEAKLWTALRDQPEAKYLGMTIPRFLVRPPYGCETDPLETFSFEEFADEPPHGGYVWANSCFAAAVLLAESYSEYGWEMGRTLKQDIEGLPTHTYTHNGETIFKSSAEVQLSQNASERLSEAGLMPLVSFKNTDRVRLLRFQSISDPVTPLLGRWN